MADAKGLMAGKRGLVMGVANDHSIAWGIARALSSQGAEIAFTYQGEAQAKRLKPLAASIGSRIVLPGDVERDEELDAAFAALKNEWGSRELPADACHLLLLVHRRGAACGATDDAARARRARRLAHNTYLSGRIAR